MSRLRSHLAGAAWAAAILFAGLVWPLAASLGVASAAEVPEGFRVEVVVTGIPRPIQLALDAQGTLVVLGQGWRGDAAAELYRIDPRTYQANYQSAQARLAENEAQRVFGLQRAAYLRHPYPSYEDPDQDSKSHFHIRLCAIPRSLDMDGCPGASRRFVG